jgi:ABC-2 type transport system permease protein
VSVRGTVRALPALFKVGFAEAVAYRAELFVWVLSTTMPLVMYVLWSAVAREAPVGRYGEREFLAYFLAAFIVRQLTSNWAAWQMNFEVRQGILSMRLLRPLSPVLAWAVETLSYMPMRFFVILPAVTTWLVALRGEYFPSSPAGWLLFVLSAMGGWLLVFVINVCVGTLSLFMKSSLKLMDAYLAATFVFSGYLIPVELFPAKLGAVVQWLPFRYTIGLPVEMLTSHHGLEAGARLVAVQWGWCAVFAAVGAVLWRHGIRRFEAYGG